MNLTPLDRQRGFHVYIGAWIRADVAELTTLFFHVANQVFFSIAHLYLVKVRGHILWGPLGLLVGSAHLGIVIVFNAHHSNSEDISWEKFEIST